MDENENPIPPVTLSRRNFIRLAAGSVAAAAATTACKTVGIPIPHNGQSSEIPLPTLAPTSKPLTNAGNETNQVQQTDLDATKPSDNEVIQQDGIDIIMIDNRGLTTMELLKYIESCKEKDKPPVHIRQTEYFVGSTAWDKWQKGEKFNGETLTSFISRHDKRLNEILMRSRPNSGVSHMRVSDEEHRSKIIVVDENSLVGLYPNAENNITYRADCPPSNDVYNRVFITDTNYSPTVSSSYYVHTDHISGELFDDGFIHEQFHYGFNLIDHLSDYFRSDTNNLGLIIVPPFISKDNISLFRPDEMNYQHRTSLGLFTTNHWDGGDSILSHPEELDLKRLAIQEPSNSFITFNEDYLRHTHYSADLAYAYRFRFTDGEFNQAKMYPARLGGVSGFNTFEWNFDVEPIPCEVTNNVVSIISGFEGGIVDKDGRETALPRAFVMVLEGQGEPKSIFFTSRHLRYWYFSAQMERQISEGISPQNALVGEDGPMLDVTLDLSQFENI